MVMIFVIYLAKTRKQFGMVLQDAWLYEGNPSKKTFALVISTDEEIAEAAKAANADHFVRTPWWLRYGNEPGV